MARIDSKDYTLLIDYEKVLGGDWACILEDSLLNTDYMTKLMMFLHEAYKIGNVFPSKDDIFKTFIKTQVADLKVVILCHEPYRNNQSTGIPLANEDKFGVRFSEPLIKWSNGIERDLYDGIKLDNNPDLEHLGGQGVLMLDCALTSSVSKPLAHIVYWRNFIRQVLGSIYNWAPNTVFVFLGSEASKYAKDVPKSSYKLYSAHPMDAIKNNTQWNASVLIEVQKILTRLNPKQLEIVW